MNPAASLALIAVGAILTFAVRASSPVFSPQIAGVVLILVGLAGLFIKGKGYGWLRKRLIIPRGRGRRPAVVEETRYPPYVARNPGTARSDAGLPEEPFIDPDPEQARYTAPFSHRHPGDPPSTGVPDEEIVEEYHDDQ